MDPTYKFPASPGAPLNQVSPDRVNQQRFDLDTSARVRLFDSEQRHSRESSVQEKAAKFDTLAFQGKALERRANDAALKRAMLGREEAETDMRRYRDEARQLRKDVQEGKDRERKVGERLESMMENYGRAKETYAHTQALWEKEIRRARKDTFKSQSVIVKLQEELKAVRTQLRKSQSDVDDEKERSNKREQEAFEARYQLVGLQEELTALMEKLKLVEQERDALRTIAKNEEVARIAAEGQLPLPKLSADDEFASPRKASAPLRRVSIMSSLASEDEIDHLKQSLEWERQRADRAFDLVDYMNMECQFKCCSCKVSESTGKGHHSPSPRATRTSIHEPSTNQTEATTTNERSDDSDPTDFSQPRTIFIPSEGIFRTISPTLQVSPRMSLAKASLPAPISSFSQADEPLISLQSPIRPSLHARTPSCEPPATAILPNNASLLSLLDSPSSPAASEATVVHHQIHSRRETVENSIYNAADPVVPADQSSDHIVVHEDNPDVSHRLHVSMDQVVEAASPAPAPPSHTTLPAPQPEPHFHTISTTTRIPLALPADELTHPNPAQSFSSLPSNVLPANLDSALSPTVTREEALAMIRERRGRARSLHQAQVNALMTPKKGRDVSAPGVVGGMATGPRSARSVSRGRLNRV